MVDLLHRYANLPRPSTIDTYTTIRPVPIANPRIHNTRKRLGSEITPQLVADYEAGQSTPALMKRYKLGKGTVLKILNEAGVVRKQRHPSPEQVDEIVELYQQGWSLVRIGEYVDFDQSAVWHWLKERGVKRRKSWERDCSRNI